MDDLESLRARLREFAEAREWRRFHAPKNLAMALAAESGELLEVFQWMGEAESRTPDERARAAAAEEMADVLLYLVRLADELDIDLVAAAGRKLELNARKYPVDKARGNSKKYDEL